MYLLDLLLSLLLVLFCDFIWLWLLVCVVFDLVAVWMLLLFVVWVDCVVGVLDGGFGVRLICCICFGFRIWCVSFVVCCWRVYLC